MGVVIINGRSYDSVTGLLIDDKQATSSHTTSSQESPDWVSSFVDEAKVKSATKPAASHHSTSLAGSATRSNKQAAVKAELKSAHQANRQIRSARTGKARHGVQESYTLNRRFVRKPVSEIHRAYRESMVDKEIAQAARRLARPASDTRDEFRTTPKVVDDIIAKPQQIKVNTANAKAVASKQAQTADIDQPFNPILTKAQAQHVASVNNQPSLEERLAAEKRRREEMRRREEEAAKARLEQIAAQRRHETKRLNTLSQMLQNVQELEDQKAEEESRAAEIAREAKAAKDSIIKNTKQAKTKRAAKRRFKPSTIFATAGAAAIVVGLGIYIALPTVSIKIAASKAGIDAKQPVTTSGYSIDGTVAYEQGKVTINYRNHSGGEGYSVEQAASSDTNTTIAQEAAKKDANSYHETDAKGKTVYFYNNYASWVNNGIRYTVNSNDYLDDNQILDIANSL